MPVESTNSIDSKMGLVDILCSDVLSSTFNIYPITEPLLSDDIWKKFELDFPDLTGFDEIFQDMSAHVKTESSSLYPSANVSDICEIRNHDCMWAGHCGSKEHPADEPRLHLNCITSSPAPDTIKVPAPMIMIKQEHGTQPVPCQQSLLKPAVRAAASAAAAVPLIQTPQTPPMSDDEEIKPKPTKVLQILNEAISECDLDEDSDLCEYFEDGDEVNVTDPVDVKPNVRIYQCAAENDHSYHKDKYSSMRMANLGIDTPSDSEEEIDVVSVVDKLTFNNRMVNSLPTNPSNRDRHQIQRRVATAISKKRISGSIKTILPIKKSSPEISPVKRKPAAESRGIKRPKQYRTPVNTTPHKRRNCGNSSDSEPEPSEKRSLHNNMERQRRIDLRNAFEDLRILVPEVSKKERAAKVVILREAAQYCDLLGNASSNYTKHLENLKKQQEWLRSRVSQLRRNLAAKR